MGGNSSSAQHAGGETSILAKCSRCNTFNLCLTVARRISLVADEYGLDRNTTLCHSCWPTQRNANGRGSSTITEEEATHAKTMATPCSIEAIQQVHMQAKAFTQAKLATKPRDASDAAILPHLLKALAGDGPVTFGDDSSSAGSDTAVHMLHALNPDSSSTKGEWNLVLAAPPDWCNTTSVQELLGDQQKRQSFEAESRQRIAKSLQVSESGVRITSISQGSVQVKYTVDDLTATEKDNILSADVSGNLRNQFSTFQSLKISPAVLALHFNLSDLDTAGNKNFGQDGGGTFQVGGRTYHQPGGGWVRFGLKVCGKYGDDTWLTPFQHQNNWLRAFHGTKGAAKKIAESGFTASTSGKLGAGVYVSPFVEYAEGYASDLSLDTTSGRKNFKVVLQVAVHPSKIMREGYPQREVKTRSGQSSHQMYVPTGC